MKYDTNEDIEIFLSNMNNIFSKHKNLGENVNEERKFNYLYNSFPDDLVQITNIIIIKIIGKNESNN